MLSILLQTIGTWNYIECYSHFEEEWYNCFPYPFIILFVATFIPRQGVNVVSQPPNVPNIYQWKDPVSGEMILNLNHRNGYGGWHTFDVNLRGISHFKEMVVIPGYSEAMLVAFNDDNQGPYQSGWLSTIFNAAKNFFPGAEVVASSFDEFLVGAAEYVNQNPSSLPILTGEIGDTWVYGCASDPKKVTEMNRRNNSQLAMMRRINALRTSCEASGECDVNESRYYNFSRLYLLNGEHTWGGDIKSFLHDTENWTNVVVNEECEIQDAFHRCLVEKKQNYINTVATWQEQRRWGFDAPLEALRDHPLRQYINRELKAMIVAR